MNQKKYNTLVADPPWQGQGGEKHYMTLRMSTLKDMGDDVRSIMADDAHCWIWCTNATILAAHELLEAWGFEYRSMLTWIKPRLGLGRYLRNMSEHVVLGTRGNAPVEFRAQGTWLFAPVQDHSHKPEEFHQIVTRVGPGPNYLELFARRPFPGFDVWGNEVESDVALPHWPVPRQPVPGRQGDV